VDASAASLQRARENLRLNSVEERRHVLERADVFEYLRAAEGSFDLLYCGAPTFSNSKSRRGTWDLQRDHEALVRLMCRRLSPRGWAVFTTGAGKFRLSPSVEEEWDAAEISGEALPHDFRRSAGSFRAFLLKRKGAPPFPDVKGAES
jgi:23S rRNA (guanine2445-N2)-methyltransferase / 23S rRNA (guanine2069-N7)-methyltransferase